MYNPGSSSLNCSGFAIYAFTRSLDVLFANSSSFSMDIPVFLAEVNRRVNAPFYLPMSTRINCLHPEQSSQRGLFVMLVTFYGYDVALHCASTALFVASAHIQLLATRSLSFILISSVSLPCRSKLLRCGRCSDGYSWSHWRWCCYWHRFRCSCHRKSRSMSLSPVLRQIRSCSRSKDAGSSLTDYCSTVDKLVGRM